MENTLENQTAHGEPFKNKALKVAIVHDFLVNPGGAEKVTQALSELFPNAPIYTLLWDEKMKSMFPNKKIITSSLQKMYFTFNLPTKWLLFAMPRAIEEFDFSKYNIVISSSHSFAKGIITQPKTTHISYCHSPTRYLWDAYHSYIDEQNLPKVFKFLMQPLLQNLRMWDRLAASRVDYYIANSNYVANRIKKYYRKDTKVIFPPVDMPPKQDLNQPKSNYFLVLSRLSAYKKVDLAIKVFNKLKLPLKIIGDGEQIDVLQKMAKDNIELLGWKDDKTKWEYLSNARALIFPGEEDFGIVPVEAMAVGTPVIAYKKGGVLESIVDKQTGILFNEQTIESLEDAVNSFIDMENSFETNVLLSQAVKFNKQRFKIEILNFVNKVHKNA